MSSCWSFRPFAALPPGFMEPPWPVRVLCRRTKIRRNPVSCFPAIALFKQIQVEIKGERVIFEGREAVMSIEGRCGFVLGVDNQDYESDFLSNRLASSDRKAKETASDAFPVVPMVDAKSSHSGCRHRVFGEPPALVLADLLEIDLRRAQRVITEDGSWLLRGDQDKRPRDAHVRVLPGVTAKKVVDFMGSAVEVFSVVITGQYLLNHGGRLCRPPASGHASGRHWAHAVD